MLTQNMRRWERLIAGRLAAGAADLERQQAWFRAGSDAEREKLNFSLGGRDNPMPGLAEVERVLLQLTGRTCIDEPYRSDLDHLPKGWWHPPVTRACELFRLGEGFLTRVEAQRQQKHELRLPVRVLRQELSRSPPQPQLVALSPAA